MRLGWAELLVILAIVLLVVGPRRLPQLGKWFGQTIREFQQALRGGARDGRRKKEKR